MLWHISASRLISLARVSLRMEKQQATHMQVVQYSAGRTRKIKLSLTAQVMPLVLLQIFPTQMRGVETTSKRRKSLLSVGS